jgi:hypothetical protein
MFEEKKYTKFSKNVRISELTYLSIYSYILFLLRINQINQLINFFDPKLTSIENPTFMQSQPKDRQSISLRIQVF